KIEVAAPPLPDLVVSALSAPTSAAAGASIAVTDTTANQGTAQAAASTTRIYLDGTNTPIGARTVLALDAPGSSSGSTTVIIPAGTAPGPHSLIVVANDAPNTVAESNGTNNTKIPSITVYIPPPADLPVSAISAPTSAAAGASITVTDTTKNQGTGQTKVASKTCIFFSRDAILDGADTKIGERSVPILNAGSSSSFSTFPVAIPSGALPGTNYLILVADGGQIVGETNESNNTRTKSIFVAGPDLAVTALSAPTR